MNDGTQIVLSLLSVAAIAGAAWYVIVKMLPIGETIVAKITGLPKITKHLIDFVKLLIIVQALVMALGILYLGSDTTKYLVFLREGASMAQSALGSIQWLVGIALWLFIGVMFVKTLSGKEIKDD